MNILKGSRLEDQDGLDIHPTTPSPFPLSWRRTGDGDHGSRRLIWNPPVMTIALTVMCIVLGDGRGCDNVPDGVPSLWSSGE